MRPDDRSRPSADRRTVREGTGGGAGEVVSRHPCRPDPLTVFSLGSPVPGSGRKGILVLSVHQHPTVSKQVS